MAALRPSAALRNAENSTTGDKNAHVIPWAFCFRQCDSRAYINNTTDTQITTTGVIGIEPYFLFINVICINFLGIRFLQ